MKTLNIAIIRDSKGRFMKGQKACNKKEKIKKICLVCNKDYEVHPYRRNISKYCSIPCQNKAKELLKTFEGKKHKTESKFKMRIAKLGKPSGRKDISLVHSGSFKKGHKNIFIEHTESSKKKIKQARAKQILPIKTPSSEIKIQNFLKELKIEFFIHQYMDIKHAYLCDILVPSLNLVIECDGDNFHFNPKKYEADDRIFRMGMTAKERWMLDYMRTKELEIKGYIVLRIWDSEIKKMKIIDFKNKLKEIRYGQ